MGGKSSNKSHDASVSKTMPSKSKTVPGSLRDNFQGFLFWESGVGGGGGGVLDPCLGIMMPLRV